MKLLRLALPLVVAAPMALLVALPANAGRTANDGYTRSTLIGPATETGNGVRPDALDGVYAEPKDAT